MSGSDTNTKWAAIDPILAALCEFEARENGSPAPSHHFAIRQTWMASDAYLPRLALESIFSFRSTIPGFFRRYKFGLMWQRFRKSGTYPKLSSTADAIQLKLDGKRLRAFYLDREATGAGKCVKIIPKGGTEEARTRSELEMRKALTGFQTINVPKILSVHEDNRCLYITEEMITGIRYRNWRHANLFIQQGFPALSATYRKMGVHLSPLSHWYDNSVPERLSSVLHKPEDAETLLTIVQEAFAQDPEIWVSTCHRDLLPSNLCVSRGKLYFFDWELVGDAPIMEDFLKLPFKYGKSLKLLRSAIQYMKEDFPLPGGVLEKQFAAHVAEKIINKPSRQDYYLSLWQRGREVFAT